MLTKKEFEEQAKAAVKAKADEFMALLEEAMQAGKTYLVVPELEVKGSPVAAELSRRLSELGWELEVTEIIQTSGSHVPDATRFDLK